MSASTSPATTERHRETKYVSACSERKVLAQRRAPIACQNCRSRKVRCDVSDTGMPCTNCRLDDVECKLHESRRGKRPDRGVLSMPDSALFVLDAIKKRSEMQRLRSDCFQDAEQTDWKRHQNTTTETLSFGCPPRIAIRQLTTEIAGSGQESSFIPTAAAKPFQQKECHASYRSTSGTSLPAYIKPDQKRLDSADLEYLRSKGAFTIPDVNLRNELPSAYTEFVYPYLPIIKLDEVLSSIHQDDGSNQISLPLFQAIMFTAIAYANMGALTTAGYATRREARKAFFGRIKLLYDFEYEIDRVTVVQTLLHMTFWNEEPGTNKDRRIWLTAAVEIARSVGLHSYLRYSSVDLQMQRLWKRIWWSCFTRDRLMALDSRRAPTIQTEHFAVPTLSLSDFELHTPIENFSRYPIVSNFLKRDKLARLYISLTTLCVCMTGVLTPQQPQFSQGTANSAEATCDSQLSASEILCETMRRDGELEKWYSENPEQVQYLSKDSLDRCGFKEGRVIRLHQALLRGIYFASMSVFHRAQAFHPHTGSSILNELQRVSHQKVRGAANEITKICRDLMYHDLLRYLPSTGVNVFLEAVTVHFTCVNSSDPVLRGASTRQLEFCMEALHRMSDMYISADTAFSVFASAKRTFDEPSCDDHPEEIARNKQKQCVTARDAILRTSALIPSWELDGTETPDSMSTRLMHEKEQKFSDAKMTGTCVNPNAISTSICTATPPSEHSSSGAYDVRNAKDSEKPDDYVGGWLDDFFDVMDDSPMSPEG